MQISYNLYENDVKYDDISEEVESKVSEYIKSKKDEIKIVNEDYDVYVQQTFSTRPHNIINALEFPKNDSCLEVLGRYGNLTKALSARFKKVTSVETVKNRAEMNYMRNSSLKNVEVICTSDIYNLDFKIKYDVIILSGVIENVNALFNDYNLSSKQLARKLMDKYIGFLNPGGKIIILTNNSMGIKYFAGAKDYESQIAYNTIINNDYKYSKYFSKKELTEIIESLEFGKYKYYYCLPDYLNTSVIYSDEYMPSVDSSKLGYNIYYNKYDIIVLNEIEAIKSITKKGYFDIFANSYVIEIGENLSSFKFASFNNFRKEKYRLITKIKDEVAEKIGEKSHIDTLRENIGILNNLKVPTLDTVKNNVLISSYCKDENLDKCMYDVLVNKSKDKFYEMVDGWYKYIKEKMKVAENVDFKNTIFSKYNVEIEDENSNSNFTYLKNGFIDFTFDNIFEQSGEFIVYDQEWFEKNVPAEFILYRALRSFYFKNKYASIILPEKEVYERFDILKYVNLFDRLEKAWQDEIVDKNVLNFFESTYSATTTIESLNNSLEDLKFYKDIVEKQKNHIENLENLLNGKKNKWKI